MREWLTKKSIIKAVVFGAIASAAILLSACSSPEVLENNGSVPAPSLIPPSNANQLATDNLQTQTVPQITEQPAILQTTTNAPSYQTAQQPSSTTYTVKRGDSLWKISRMFEVSVNDLAAANNISSTSPLKIGTILNIPAGGLAAPRAFSETSHVGAHYKGEKVHSASSATHSTSGSYVVKSGDSLWTVAKKHGVSIKSLAEANGLTSKSTLHVGQKLVIPGGAKAEHKTSAKSSKIEKEKSTVKTEKRHEKSKKKSEENNKKETSLVNSAPSAANSEATSTTSDNSSAAASTLSSGSTNEKANSSTNNTTAAATPPSTQASQTLEQPAASASYLPHTVKDGDTWQSISDMYGVSVEDLKKANPTVANAEPKSGTVVNIPEE